jgi:heme exporter protein A
MTILRLSGHSLACRRGGRMVFRNLSFDLQEGQALILRGPNGSGKTSLLRLVAGLSQPAEGRVEWDGDLPINDSLHWIGPGNALKNDLTVRENLTFWTQISPCRHPGEGRDPRNDRDDIGYALSILNLENLAGTPVRRLSSGQKRRAALSRLFINPRPLWLLDEPEAGLDGEHANLLGGLIKNHIDEGGMAVVASHAAGWDFARSQDMIP